MEINFWLIPNIVLYLLNGDQTITDLLHEKTIYLSFISQLELLSYKGIKRQEQKIIEVFLSDCKVLDINREMKEIVIKLRKTYNLKLPDSIIVAGAIYLDIPFLTADADFKKIEKETELIFYKL